MLKKMGTKIKDMFWPCILHFLDSRLRGNDPDRWLAEAAYFLQTPVRGNDNDKVQVSRGLLDHLVAMITTQLTGVKILRNLKQNDFHE